MSSSSVGYLNIRPSVCRSSARQRFSTLSLTSQRNGSRASPLRNPTAGRSTQTSLGDDGVAIPFLRYLPERLSPLGVRVETALRERLAEVPSFVAFEGYDTVAATKLHHATLIGLCLLICSRPMT